jgi:peptide/nickel transport system permease protein
VGSSTASTESGGGQSVTRLRFFGWRLFELLVSLVVVFTGVFLYILYSPAKHTELNYDAVPVSATDPRVDQYVGLFGWLLTLWDAQVWGPIVESAQYTLVYLVPALVFAVVAGIGIRLYSIAAEGNRLNFAVDGVTLVAISIPVFILAYFLRGAVLQGLYDITGTFRLYDSTKPPYALRNLLYALYPMSVMTLYLVAIQLHYAGEELREYVAAEFVKTARAKGVSRLQLGRHVFRNTAIPLLSVFFTDMLGMVVLAIVVIEYITKVPGLGALLVEAFLQADLGLMLTLSVFILLAGVVSNLLQDVGYELFDPRVRFDR